MPHHRRDVQRSRRLIAALLLGCLAFTALALPLFGQKLSTQGAYGIPGQDPAPGFKLQTVSGAHASLADFRGQYVYLMFGYLNCPDVCHTQALLFEELQLLAAPDLPLAFVYVAIDPERDSPEQVASYFDVRGERFTSLHADSIRDLQALANQYHAFFRPGRSSTAREPAEIDHNALFFLIGPDGRLRYTYAATQNATPRLVNDLQNLTHEYQAI